MKQRIVALMTAVVLLGLTGAYAYGNAGGFTLSNDAQNNVQLNAAPAGPSIVVVDKLNADWGIFDESSAGTGTAAFINGPSTAPLGNGSIQLELDSSSSGVIVGTAQYADLRLDEITTLTYETYNTTGNNLVAPALQINIDYDLTDSTTSWQGRLVFEPYYDNTIVDGTWQQWDALAGRWWSSGNPIVGDVAVTKHCPQSSPCDLLTLLGHYPDAGVQIGGLSGVLFKAGSNWLAGYQGSVDNFTIGVNGTDTTFDFEPIPDCSTTCWVDAVNGDDSNSGQEGDPLATIQAAIDRVDVGGTVNVLAGTYAESLDVNKSVTISGAGEGDVTIDASAFDDYSIYVTADDVTLEGFTVTGNSTGSAAYGVKVADDIALEPLLNFTIQNVTVNNSRRTGVDLNGVDGALIDNVTVNDVPSGNGFALTDSNNITAQNLTTSNNAWGGFAIYTFGRFFTLGSDNVTITGTNSFGEANKVYVQRGNFNDPASPEPVTNLTVDGFDYTVMNDTFRAGGENFTFYQITQADAIAFALGLATPADSYVNEIATGEFFVGVSATDEMSIQTAIDKAVDGDTINVLPGTYNEIAEDRPQFGTGTGPYDFGLYVGKDGITIQGLDSSNNVITDYTNADIPQVISTASAAFGTQGPFISGDNVTITGLDFTPNAPGNNKNIEVVGDNFTLMHSRVRMNSGSAVYISDFNFSGDATSGTTTVTSYNISDNWMDGGIIVIANGAGFGSPMSDLVISDNLIQNASNWGIQLQGALDGIAWLNHPVGVPSITGNTFDGNYGNVRFIGTYDSYDAATYWDDILDNNTFEDGWVVVREGAGPDLRATELLGYTTRRQISSSLTEVDTAKAIQNEINRAVEGDTVEVSAGTFNESVEISTDNVTLLGSGTAETFLVSDQTCTNQMNSSAVAGVRLIGDHTGITLSGFSVSGYDIGLDIGEGIGNTITDVTITNVVTNNNCVHGILSQAGTTNGVMIDNVTANNNGSGFFAGRGLWFINGTKSDITIQNSIFNENQLVGIDISDGDVTGLLIDNNIVERNGDSGIGVLGPQGPDANVVSNNTVTDNGRFGIEIKNPDGETTVSGNTVSLTSAGSDLRDYAGIAIFRRGPGATNADQPSGVTITGNTVTGYTEPNGDGEGFGILIEGLNITATGNTVSGNDVGIQVQNANPTPNTNGTEYFDRGDASNTANVTVTNNNITDNGEGLRTIGLTEDVLGTLNWWDDASGPAGEGTGSGDTVDEDVVFCPWLDDEVGVGSPASASGSVATTSADGHTTLYCTIEEAMFASDGPNQTVLVGEGNWAGEVMNRDYSDSPNLTVIAAGDTDNTVVNGMNLTGSSFDGLTFQNLTLTGDAPTPSGYDPGYAVEITNDGNYADLAFVGNVFDGQNVEDAAAIFSNRGWDGFTLDDNQFINYNESPLTPLDDTYYANYSLVFMEAQVYTPEGRGNNYVATNNTFEGITHLNALEAFRWQNVTMTGNTITGTFGRLLVWSYAEDPLEEVVIEGNSIELSSGTDTASSTGIGVYYVDADVTISENDVTGAASCLVTNGVTNLSVTNNTFTDCETRGHLFNDSDFDDAGPNPPYVAPVSATITGNTFDTMPVGVENEAETFALNVCQNTFIDVDDLELSDPGPFEPCGQDVTVVKFNDLDEDGILDDGEPFLENWEFTVLDDQGAEVTSGTTDANGELVFSLLPGTYEICETVQANWSISTPADAISDNCTDVTVTAGGGDGISDVPTDQTTVAFDGNTYEIEFLGRSEDGLTWTYRFTEVDGKDLSNWALGVCEPADSAFPITVTEYESDAPSNNGNPIAGPRWGVNDAFSDGTFSITYDVVYAPTSVDVGVKTGGQGGEDQTGTSTITGPDCLNEETPEPSEPLVVTFGNVFEEPLDLRLNLTAECVVGDTLYWRVTNNTDTDIDFTVRGTDIELTATANDRTYFTTTDNGGANTTSIDWVNPSGNKDDVTKAHNNEPCVYHVEFDKAWLGADAPDLDGAVILTAESSLGTATCTSDDGELTCTYTTGDDLEVPFGETYSVTEADVDGWTATAGVGEGFTGIEGFEGLPAELDYDIAEDRFCTPNPDAEFPFNLEKFCEHTVTNEFTPDLRLNLTAECVVGDTLYWRVTNDTDTDIDFTVRGTDIELTATANDRTYFTTTDNGGANTTSIDWVNPSGNKDDVTKAHNNNPCVYHVEFDKAWLGADAPDLDGAVILTAESSLGTATCTSDDGELTCTYTTGDDLEVPFGEMYSVTEADVDGWTATAGVGEGFTGIEGFEGLPAELDYDIAEDRFCTPNPDAEFPFNLEKFCEHTVTNEFEPEDSQITVGKWADDDADGRRDRDTEVGVPNFPFTIVQLVDGEPVGEPVEQTTGPNGFTRFLNLEQGTYRVCETVPEGFMYTGFTQTQRSEDVTEVILEETNQVCLDVVLDESGEVADIGFGNYEFASLTIIKDAQPDAANLDWTFAVSIGDVAFADFVLDNDANSADVPSSTTLDDLLPADYTVSEIEMPEHFDLTDVTCTVDDVEIDLTEDLANGTVTVPVAAGQDVVCTFINQREGQLFISKYNDANSNATRDEGEVGIAGVEMSIFLDGVQIQRTKTTNADGNVVFTSLEPGIYDVCETLPEGYTNTQPGLEADANGLVCQSIEVPYSVNTYVAFGNAEEPEVTPEPTVEVTPEVTPEPTVEVTPEPTVEVTPEVTPEPTVEVTPEVTPEPTVEVTPDVTPEVTEPVVTTPEPTVEVTPDVTPDVTPEVTPPALPRFSIGSCYLESAGTFTLTIVNRDVAGYLGYDAYREGSIVDLGYFEANETRVIEGVTALNDNADTLRKFVRLHPDDEWTQRGGTHVLNADNATRCEEPATTPEPTVEVTPDVTAEPTVEVTPEPTVEVTPDVTEPVVTTPEPTEPVVTTPEPTEPVVTTPEPTEPVVTTPAPTEPVVTTPEPTEPAPGVNVNALSVCWIENPNGNTSAWRITNPNQVPLIAGEQAKVMYDWTVFSYGEDGDTVVQSGMRWDQTGETRVNTNLADYIVVRYYVDDNGTRRTINGSDSTIIVLDAVTATEADQCESDEPAPTETEVEDRVAPVVATTPAPTAEATTPAATPDATQPPETTPVATEDASPVGTEESPSAETTPPAESTEEGGS